MSMLKTPETLVQEHAADRFSRRAFPPRTSWPYNVLGIRNVRVPAIFLQKAKPAH